MQNITIYDREKLEILPATKIRGPMINAEQIRAARALLDWSTAELAKKAGMTVNGINKIERGHVNAHRDTLESLTKIFEEAGIEFLPASGLRKRDRMIKVLEGSNAAHQLLDDIYLTLRNSGDAVRITGSDETLFLKNVSRATLDAHLARLNECGISERMLTRFGDTHFVGPLDTYHWIPEKYFSPYHFYIYGSKLALVSWEPPQKVIIINDERFADSARKLFDFAWDKTEIPAVSKIRR